MAASGTVVPSARSSFMAAVDKHSGQRVMSCYQCGKCTAGCPVASSADLGPRQVMRAVQLGRREEALGNELIWLCLSCQTCTARCPRQIEVAAVMESLRLMAIAQGHPTPASDLSIFHRVFLSAVKRGRVHEFGIGTLFNMLSRQPFKNVGLLPKLLARGKLGVLPPHAEASAQLKTIFERVAELEGQSLGLPVEACTVAKSGAAAAAVGVGVLAGARALRGREAKE